VATRPVDGCTLWCCTVNKLTAIPPKPSNVAWVGYAPHLTGRQVIRLAERWQAAGQSRESATSQ